MNVVAWLIIVVLALIIGINLYTTIRDYISKKKSKGNKPDDNDKKGVNE